LRIKHRIISIECLIFLNCVWESTSITWRRCATRVAGATPTRWRRRMRPSRPAPTASRRTCARTAIAVKTRPHAACVVPERRQEVTTEGGLDVAGMHNTLKPVVARLSEAGIRVSLFIAADARQIEAAVQVGAPVIEIHTGAWCDAVAAGRSGEAEFELIRTGAQLARAAGLEVHAGHGLDYATAETIAALPEVVELNIGHFLVGAALSDGLAAAVKTMRAAMDRGRAKASATR